jgi:hypothetical protein
MVEARVAQGAVCDFCSDEEPHYLENCETFVATLLDGRTVGRSRGDWASCPTCHGMIATRKWHALKRRAVEAMVAKYPDKPKNRIEHGVDIIHAQFRAHKPVESLNP